MEGNVRGSHNEMEGERERGNQSIVDSSGMQDREKRKIMKEKKRRGMT